MNEPDKKSDEVTPGDAKRAFDAGVIVRGEAGIPDENGVLPPGVTHEIVGNQPDGTPILVRRRFSSF